MNRRNDLTLGQHLLDGPTYSPPQGWGRHFLCTATPYLYLSHLLPLRSPPHTPTLRSRGSPAGPPVEPDELLPQHGVHGLLIDDGVQLHDCFQVKVARKLGEYVLGQLLSHFLEGQQRLRGRGGSG